MATPQLIALAWQIEPVSNRVYGILVSGRIPIVDGTLTDYAQKHKHLEVSTLSAVPRSRIQRVADDALAWIIAQRENERSAG